MDLAKSFPVSSTEPRKLDRVKKGLVEDRGYLSDSGKVSLSPTSPALPPQTPRGSHPHRVSLAQRPSTSPQSFPLTTWPTPPSSKILFYHAHDPYYGFTNFSPDPIEYNGKKYPTSEHLFQAHCIVHGAPPRARRTH